MIGACEDASRKAGSSHSNRQQNRSRNCVTVAAHIMASREIELREHLPRLLRLTVLFASAVVVMAQTDHITAFTGTWKLNGAESKFNPGPPFKGFTLTFAPDGTRKLDLIGADGQPIKASLPWSDGKEVVVTVIEGMGNVTATSRIQGRVLDDTWKENGKIIEQVHGVVSPDARTLTITVDGTDKQGQAFHNRLRFDRQ